MNYKTKYFLFGMIILFIQIGCKNQKKVTSSSFRSIPITVEDYSAIEALQMEDLRLISLSSGEDFLIDQIAKILFCDGLIFIKPWNQNKILVFSETGEGLHIIDCEGVEKKYQLDFNHPVIDFQAFENLMSGDVDIYQFDYVMDVKYLESEKYLIMNYTYKRISYMFVYDKEKATGQNFIIETKSPCRAIDRFPLLSLKQNSLVFAVPAGNPTCLDVFDDVPGTQDILDQLESREENENLSLLIASLAD